jgi:hypothetical protein
MEGFRSIYRQALRLGVPGDLVVDGSYLTEEIDPDDIDFAVVVSPDFYENCGTDQRKFLEWIRDDKTISSTHLCDCYLCVEWPKDHEQYFDGIQSRVYWVNLFSKSTVYKRDRGVVIVSLENEFDL